MRLWKALAACVATGIAASAAADAVYEDGLAIETAVSAMQNAIRSRTADDYLRAFDADPGVVLRVKGAAFVGAAPMRTAWTNRVAALAKPTMTRARILLDRSTAWSFFDWKAGNESGAHIVYWEKRDEWRALAADFDGTTLASPDEAFNPTKPFAHLNAAIDAMTQAAAAMDPLDMPKLEQRIDAPNFVFYSPEGVRYEAAEALLRMAFTRIPDGVDGAEMALLMSAITNRATAFQDIDGERLSLGLKRQAGEWRIVSASFSRELDTLAVSPRGRLAVSWGALRQR